MSRGLAVVLCGSELPAIKNQRRMLMGRGRADHPAEMQSMVAGWYDLECLAFEDRRTASQGTGAPGSRLENDASPLVRRRRCKFRCDVRVGSTPEHQLRNAWRAVTKRSF